MERLVIATDMVLAPLNKLGDWLPPLFLRAILAWEYWEAGITKLNGENWFTGIQQSFPFPFHLMPVELNWWMATWTEIIAAAALLLGFMTRFFSSALIVLTIVAALAVHWPDQWDSLGELWQGYAISDKGSGNYKLPLLYLIMLLPLVCSGPGKLSVDHLVRLWTD